MNKNRYRIIFSHARGMFIAVAEIVKSKTKQAGQSQGVSGTDSTTVSVLPIHYKKLNPLNFAVIGCLGALVISLPMSSVAETQISADKGAPTSQQPTILTSANGTTQVNIQTPSAGGVSRNTYTQFDVGQEGVILNNSRNNTQTQLGGWVQGNPWLAKGEAKVILNEVNSNNPSQLKGYIEVAGKQAQVVIANPSGLICDGCGVINADRFTLTTGQAVMNQGYLESFRVREGQVTIEGKGLNGSLTPYTDIYARALKVNAGLYANELNTVLGQNDIQVKDQVAPQITATTGPITTPPPNFALDVGQLGGMYAGKIFLVGTEQGLGVRNAGTINSTQGTLTLNANGDLVNNGNLIANKDQVQLKAQNIQNTGNVSSATSQISIESQSLDNSGLISSADELRLNQQNSLSNSGTLNAARLVIDADSLKNSGSIEQTGLQGLDLKSGSMTNLGGKIGVAKSNTSGGTAGNSSGNTGSTVIVPTVPVDPAQDGGSLGVVPPIDTTPKTYDTGFIHVSGVLGNDQGTIIANGGVDLESQNGLDNQGGQLNLGIVTIKGSNFNNDLGQLNVKQADIQTLGFTNQQGQLASSDTLKIQSQNANNRSGKIQSIGQLDLAIGGELNNSKGYVASGDNVLVSAGDLNNQFGVVYSENQSVNIKANQAIDNTEGVIQAKTDLNLNSQTLNNTSGQIIGNQIQQQHGTVNNSQGAIIAKQNLNSTAQQFDNDQGQLQATTVQLQHDQLKNTGGIYADKDLTVTGKDIQNSGSLAAGENVKITSLALEHAQNGLIAAGLDREGKLADTGMLTINVDRAGLHGQTFAGQHIQINATGTIDAAQGQLQSKTIALNAGTDISTQAATVVAQDQLKLASQNLINNQQGQLNSQDIILSAQQLDNSQGKIQHTGNNEFTLNFVNGLNNKLGEISSNAALMQLNNSILNNEAGQIIHSGNQQLNINSNQLQGAQGKILSNGQLVLATEQAILDGAITSADQINITAYNLSHQKGQMIQRGTLKPLTLAIRDQINNQLGFIQSPTALYITAGSLNNQGGQLSSAADHDLQLDVAGLLDNSQSGQIYAGLNNNIHAGSINNSMAGQISAQNALTLTSLGLINNQSGKIVANADVGIRSEGLDNTNGQIGSVQAGLTLDVGTGKLTNQSGSLQADKNIEIKADQLKTQAGLISAQGIIQAQINQDIDNSSGQIVANKSVLLSSQGLNNNQGVIASIQDELNINAGRLALTNQAGLLQSGRNMNLITRGIDNSSGTIDSAGRLQMSGPIQTGQSTLSSTPPWLMNTAGIIKMGTDFHLDASQFDNRGGTLQTRDGYDLSLNITGQLDNSQGGQLQSGHDLMIASGSMNNEHGHLSAQGLASVKADHGLDNTAGSIIANADVNVSNQGLNRTSTINDQGTIGSVQGQLTIDAGQGLLSNQHGTLQAATRLDLNAADIDSTSGSIQAQDDIQIISATALNNQSGHIVTTAGSIIATANSLDNRAGLILSNPQHDITLTVSDLLDNRQQGQINSGHRIGISAGQLNNNSGQITAQSTANLNINQDINNNNGSIIAYDDVTTTSVGVNNDAGKISSAKGLLSIDAGTGVLSSQVGTLQAGTNLTAAAASINNTAQGLISALNAVTLTSTGLINNDTGSIIANHDVNLTSQGLSNHAGEIGSITGVLNANAGNAALSNQSGRIQAATAIALTAVGIDNTAGNISSQGTATVDSRQIITNQSGRLIANNNLNVTSEGLNNNLGQIGSANGLLNLNTGNGALSSRSGKLQAATTATVIAHDIDNTSGLIDAQGNVLLTSQTGLVNQGGQIESATGTINASAATLNNQAGLIQTNPDNDIHLTIIGMLDNGQKGQILSGANALLQLGQLNNSTGQISAQGTATVKTAQDINNTAGNIVANGDVNLTSQGLNNNQGMIGSAQGLLAIEAGRGILSSQGGHLQSAKTLNLSANSIDNTAGSIEAVGDISLSSQKALINQTGQIASTAGNINVIASDLNNQTGRIQSNSGFDVGLSVSDLLDNSQTGMIGSGNTLTINSGVINNQSGSITAQNSASIHAAQSIDNTAGAIAANHDITMSSQGLSNDAVDRSGKMVAGQISSVQGLLDIDAGQGSLSNQGGQLLAGTDLTLHSGSLNNEQGRMSAQNKLTITSIGLINNRTGHMIANHDVHLQSQGLNNSQSGQIASLQGQVWLDAGTGLLNNSQSGLIQATMDSTLHAAGIDNSADGQIKTQGALNIQSSQLVNNRAGQITANHDVQVSSQGLDNAQQGLVGSVSGALNIDAGQGLLNNQQGGQLLAATTADLKAADIDNSNAGIINAHNDIQIQSLGEINNQNKGQIVSGAGDISVIANQFGNQGGVIQTYPDHDIHLNVKGILDNSAFNGTAGQINSGHSLSISSSLINNQFGSMASQDTLSVTTAQRIDNTAGHIAAGNTVNIHSNGLINDAAVDAEGHLVAGQIGSVHDALSIDAGQDSLSNRGGKLLAATTVQLNALNIDNSNAGKINAQNDITIQTQGTLGNQNHGQIVSATGNINATANGLNNQQGLIETYLNHDIDLTLKDTLDNSQSGTISSGNRLNISSDSVDNHLGTLLAQEMASIQTKQGINNTAGKITANQDIGINSTGLINDSGLIGSASGQLQVDAGLGSLTNHAGQLLSAGNMDLHAAGIDNSGQGEINTQAQLNINSDQVLSNSDAGQIIAKQDLSIHSDGLDNYNAGRIGSQQGMLNLNIGTGLLNNSQQGLLQAATDLNIESGSIDNSHTLSAAQSNGIKAGGKLQLISQQSLNNQQGAIVAGKTLSIHSTEVNNDQGLMNSLDDLGIVTSGALTNQHGQLQSATNLSIESDSLNNDHGDLSAQNTLAVSINQEINNVGGHIAAFNDVNLHSNGLNNNAVSNAAGSMDVSQIGSVYGNLNIDAGRGALTNQGSSLQAGRSIQLSADGIDSSNGGYIHAVQNIELNSQHRLNNDYGQIVADSGSIYSQSSDLSNLGGIILTQGLNNSVSPDIVLKQSGILDNRQNGQISSSNQLNISSGSIQNDQGDIHSKNTATLNTVQKIDNTAGKIAAINNVTVNSNGLINDTGHIGSVNGDLNVDAGSGVLSNQRGDLQSGHNASIAATGIDNQTGHIFANQALSIDSRGQALQNQQGQISGTGVQLSSGALDNGQSGLIQSGALLSINTHGQALNNQNSGDTGGILSRGDLTLNQISQLDNTSGYIASGNDLNGNVDQVLNSHGQLIAAHDLNLQSNGASGSMLLNDQSGQVNAGHDISVHLDSINNQGGHLVAANQLNLTSNVLDNQNTNNNLGTQGIDATTFNLNVNSLNNQSGAIRANDRAVLNIVQQLNNNQGSISGQNLLSVVGSTTSGGLVVTNSQGLLSAGKQLDLSSQSLSSEGRILSLGDATLNLGSSYTQTADNSSQLQANGHLTLNTTGDINNNGVIQAGQTLSLNAANINNGLNNSTARLESYDTQLSAQQQINNQGLINGELTTLRANTVNNTGTGRIYGTSLAIGANTLNNAPNSSGVAPVIASRGDMLLGVQTLNNMENPTDQNKGMQGTNNGAQIISLGDMHIGGALDSNRQVTGQASTLNNRSATINVDGNLRLDVDQVNNQNLYVNTEIRSSAPEQIDYWDMKANNPGWMWLNGRYNPGADSLITDVMYAQMAAQLSHLSGTTTAVSSNLESTSSSLPQFSSRNGNGSLEDYLAQSEGKFFIVSNYADSSRGQMTKGYLVLNGKLYTTDTYDHTYGTQTVTAPYVTNSAAGVISVGGNLSFSGAINNDKSQILVGGTLLGDQGQSIANLGMSVDQVTRISGQVDHYVGYYGGSGHDHIGIQDSTTNIPTKTTPLELFSSAPITGHQQVIRLNPSIDARNTDKIGTGIATATGTDGRSKDQQSLNNSTTVHGTTAQGGEATQVEAIKNSSQQGLNIHAAEGVGNRTGAIDQATVGAGNTAIDTTRNSNTALNVDTATTVAKQQVSIGQTGQVSGSTAVSGVQVTDSGITIVSLAGPEHGSAGPLDTLKVQTGNIGGSGLDGEVKNSTTVNQASMLTGEQAQQAQANATNSSVATGTKAVTAPSYEIRTINTDGQKISNSALYRINPDSRSGYIIETDPDFSQYRQWLSSDYMLNALGLDPAFQQKRLGDGYYEQRQVQDQIAKLTGSRYLVGYHSDEEQYKALLDAGVTFAQQYSLSPGVALTAAQMAELTSDIVWLVEKEVTLTNGTTTRALVPQVYVRAKAGDLLGDGSLIAANDIQLKLKGNVLNEATIAGRHALQISAEQIDNIGGRIEGNQVALTTQKDLNNIGGTLKAGSAMALNVGGNFNHVSTSSTSISGNPVFGQGGMNGISGNYTSQTSIDRIAGLYVGDGTGPIDPNNVSLVMNVGGKSTLTAAKIENRNGASLIQIQGNVELGTIKVGQQYDNGVSGSGRYGSGSSQEIGSSITSVGNTVITGNNIHGTAVKLGSQQGDVALLAEHNLTLDDGRSLNEEHYTTGNKKNGSSHDANTSSSQASQINAGQNLILHSAHGDINTTNLQGQAENIIQIHADEGNVHLTSAINEQSGQDSSHKTSWIKSSSSQSGYVHQQVAQSQLRAGNNIDINAKNDISLQAIDAEAGKSIYVGNTLMQRQADGTLKAADGSVMPKNVLLSTLETHNQQWEEQQKGYRGIAKELVKGLAIGLPGLQAAAPGLDLQKKLTVGESNSHRTEETHQSGTSLSAENIAVGSSGQTTLTSADLTAKNVALSGQKVILNAAEEQSIESSSHTIETIEGLGVKLNKDSIRLGGFVSEKDKNTLTTTETTHKAGTINTDNLSIKGTEGVDVLGQNIKATGDTTIDHGRGELNIGGYENKTTTEEKTKNEKISTEVGVRNAYLDAALAVVVVKDAASALKDAKNAYSQAQRDYAAGKLTKEALDDSKANVAMATANLASAQIAVAASVAAAAANSGTYGFTIGANGEHIETTATTTTTQGQWQGSHLDLNNLTLKSEDQNANIQGSRLSVAGTTTFNGTKDLNITAGIEHGSKESSSKTTSQSVSYTYGGGGGASIGKQTSQSQSESLTHVNSEVALNRTEGQLNKLNIQGGEVSIADRGNLQVNQILVESLQDTAKSSNSSKGGSIGAGFGSSGISNVSASYNQSKGSSDSAWVNNTSKLLIGDKDHDANLDAMGVKQVTNIGGVIANATKNADGTLTDHKDLNYSGALELKDLQDHNYNSSRGFNVSTTIGKTTQEKDGEKGKYPNGSTTLGLQSNGQETEQLTKATMGLGTVKNTTELTNRDINTTQEITRDQTTGMLNGSVTVDHRLLSESGRAEIVQQQKDLPENFRQSAENLAKALPDGAYKDKALQTLNNVQAKLYNLPSEYKEAGVVGNNVASELLKRGMESKDVEALFSKLDFFYAAKEFSEIKNQLTDLEKSGFDLETIFRQPKSGVNEEKTIYAQGTDFETKVSSQTTLGMTILSNVADLGNSIKDISESTGVDIEKVQLAVGLLISGPVRLVVESGKSMAVDSLVGDKVAQGIDILANSMTAAAHDTSVNTINNWTNPDKISELENSTSENKEASLEFANEVQKDKQGAEYLINAAAGIVVGGIGGTAKTTKIDGKDVEVSTAGIGSNSKKDPVKELEVGSYQELKSRAQVGDGLEHDHIPSFAALKKAKENELGRKLTDNEAKALYNDATTIEISRETHKAGRTYGGKNTSEQIVKDASNLCEAQRCDIDVLRQNLLERGHSQKAVDEAIIKLKERNKDKGIY